MADIRTNPTNGFFAVYWIKALRFWGRSRRESYGSPAGRKVFSAFYDLMLKDYKLDAKVSLVAQSRGGLMLYNWL